ncbi:hypothetical protein GCM10028814_18620 [Angustibacter aerolatus]
MPVPETADPELVVPPDAVVLPSRRATWTSTGLTAALAALLTATAYVGAWPLAAVCALGAAAMAWGWPVLLALPSPRGTTSVVAGGGVLAAVAVALTTEEPLLRWLSLALAVSVVGEFVHQLARRDARPRMVESVTGSVAGLVLVSSLAAVVALPRSPVGGGGVLVWAVPVALALVPLALPLPGRVAMPLGVLVGLVAGGQLGGLQHDGHVLAGLVAGGVSAGVVLLLHRLLAVLPPAAGSLAGRVALAVAPLAGSGMVAYVAVRLLAR